MDRLTRQSNEKLVPPIVASNAAATDGMTFLRLVPALFETTLCLIKTACSNGTVEFRLRPEETKEKVIWYIEHQHPAMMDGLQLIAGDIARLTQITAESEKAATLTLSLHNVSDQAAAFAPHAGMRLIYDTLPNEVRWVIAQISDAHNVRLSALAFWVDIVTPDASAEIGLPLGEKRTLLLEKLAGYKNDLTEYQYPGAGEIDSGLFARTSAFIFSPELFARSLNPYPSLQSIYEASESDVSHPANAFAGHAIVHASGEHSHAGFGGAVLAAAYEGAAHEAHASETDSGNHGVTSEHQNSGSRGGEHEGHAIETHAEHESVEHEAHAEHQEPIHEIQAEHGGDEHEPHVEHEGMEHREHAEHQVEEHVAHADHRSEAHVPQSEHIGGAHYAHAEHAAGVHLAHVEHVVAGHGAHAAGEHVLHSGHVGGGAQGLHGEHLGGGHDAHLAHGAEHGRPAEHAGSGHEAQMRHEESGRSAHAEHEGGAHDARGAHHEERAREEREPREENEREEREPREENGREEREPREENGREEREPREENEREEREPRENEREEREPREKNENEKREPRDENGNENRERNNEHGNEEHERGDEHQGRGRDEHQEREHGDRSEYRGGEREARMGRERVEGRSANVRQGAERMAYTAGEHRIRVVHSADIQISRISGQTHAVRWPVRDPGHRIMTNVGNFARMYAGGHLAAGQALNVEEHLHRPNLYKPLVKAQKDAKGAPLAHHREGKMVKSFEAEANREAQRSYRWMLAKNPHAPGDIYISPDAARPRNANKVMPKPSPFPSPFRDELIDPAA